MWISPIKTPVIVQVDFGPWGQNLPGDGEAYCGPTSIVMGLYWLSANGFTQVAPSVYNGQDDPAAVNLELVVAGLVGTSSETGTGGMDGVTTYLAACGITITADQNPGIANPDLDWIVTHVAPNVASDPESIVLAQFSVGWYSQDQSDPTLWDNDGGHVLVPIGIVPGGLLLNNAYPASFYDVPNLPENGQQVVQIVPVPSGLTLQNLSLPSQDYTQILSGNKGSNGSYAVLWGAATWIIPSSARPAIEGYQPAIWTIDAPQYMYTNGGNLPVLAPVTGTGSFLKDGDGVLLLTNTNQLSGDNVVSGGILASTQTSGAPFGTGSVTLEGGGLQLGVDADVAVAATIASGAGGTLAIDAGAGRLILTGTGSFAVTIGGNTDGSTANLTRQAAGTLVLAPGGGTAALGATQQVVVAGSDGNLPPVSNGIVAPWLLGQDSDAASSGVFLDYNEAGFDPATVTLSSNVGIGSLSGDDTVYDVVDTQTLEGDAAATVAALEIDNGEVAGADATLTVGSQVSGDVAGVILNGGTSTVGTLAFGASEAVIYTSNDGGVITSTLSGSGGLTTFGPGSLLLSGDSESTLTGQVTLNAGTLILAGSTGSPSGWGDITVNAGATLQVLGAGGFVGTTVTVESSGILDMNGGTLTSDVDVTAIGANYGSDPGGILQGNGTIAGTVNIGGVVQAGPNSGVLTFGNDTTFQENSALYWQLQGYHDDESQAPPGTWWNVLTFNSSNSAIGAQGAAISLFVDFSKLDGDPDGGNPFWLKQRTWTFMNLTNGVASAWWTYANFSFLSGDFITLPWNDSVVQLQWNPLATRRTPDERRRAEALGRRRPVGRPVIPSRAA
jgi:autotransporter-associated beta strand protein